MVEVGERTGRVEQIFMRLGEHYDHLVRLQRALLWGLAWPLFELCAGLSVIGLFIWILGVVWSGSGEPPVTFLGLYGTRGLAIYAGTLGAIAALIALSIAAVKHGWIDLDPLLRLMIHVPGIGTGLRTLAMSRLTWSLALATDSDLDARRAAELAMRTTQNSYYTDHIDGIQHSIRAGSELHTAFRRTGVFPTDFLDTLETGEISGRISEAMQVLAKEYEDRARNYYRLLTVAAGAVVILLVFLLIITMIFQLFMQYLNVLDGAGRI
jgi:type II secretory pathway component PulF